MLPAAWVDRLFARLIATYGIGFMRQYEGIKADDVKLLWRQELSRFEDWPDAIKYAIDNLPERPPNLIEFRNLCRRAPRQEPIRIEAPPANPERVKAELAKLDEIRREPTSTTGVEWAQRIMQSYQMGNRHSRVALRDAQIALRNRGLL